MVYWKEAFMHQIVDAEKVFKELEKISEKTPMNIVEKAKNDKSEMHKCFTWDEGKAAEAWRLQEARQMVNHLVVKCDVITQKNEHVSVVINVFSSIPTDEGRRFVKTSDGMNNEILKQMIVSEVQSLLSQAKIKMTAHKIFFAAKHFEEVDILIEEMAI